MSFRPREARKLAQDHPFLQQQRRDPPPAFQAGHLSAGTLFPRTPQLSRSPALPSPLRGSGAVNGARPCRLDLFGTGRKTRGGVLGDGAGRGDARRRSGRQVGQRRRRAPHLMQSAFRKRAPRPRSRRKRSCALSRPLRHPPAYRPFSPLDFVPGGRRHSATHRGPAGGVGKSPP